MSLLVPSTGDGVAELLLIGLFLGPGFAIQWLLRIFRYAARASTT
jgi:hypothetical protein